MKFNIQRLEWEIILVDPSEIEDDNTQSLGETYYTDLLIKIADTDNKSKMKSTIIHELTHAFRWTYGHISSVGIAGWPSEEVEEQIANTLEVHGEEIINLADKLIDKVKKW